MHPNSPSNASSFSRRHNPQEMPDPSLDDVFSSTRTVLNHPSSPTLREILAAYNAHGNGDRDKLLATLNAKAAEDRRLASLAALHQTMLEASQLRQHQSPLSWPLPRKTTHPRNIHHYNVSFGRKPPHTRASLVAMWAPIARLDHRGKWVRSSPSPSTPHPSRPGGFGCHSYSELLAGVPASSDPIVDSARPRPSMR
ncbi:hypothetical protein K438DRAFT_1733915, partial [Mycena galopus ATCC 62051]